MMPRLILSQRIHWHQVVWHYVNDSDRARLQAGQCQGRKSGITHRTSAAASLQLPFANSRIYIITISKQYILISTIFSVLNFILKF